MAPNLNRCSLSWLKRKSDQKGSPSSAKIWWVYSCCCWAGSTGTLPWAKRDFFHLPRFGQSAGAACSYYFIARRNSSAQVMRTNPFFFNFWKISQLFFSLAENSAWALAELLGSSLGRSRIFERGLDNHLLYGLQTMLSSTNVEGLHWSSTALGMLALSSEWFTFWSS